MAEELAFVIINPYTIRKSRTGGVLGRLLSRSSAELVAARMFAPTRELVDAYINTIGINKNHKNWHVRRLIQDYINRHYAPDRKGRRHRVMFLLFRGEDAVQDLMENVVGPITRFSIHGETVRDTYGDYIRNHDGKVVYFEPAVLGIPFQQEAAAALDVWARYSGKDGGLLDKVIPYHEGQRIEATAVLLKPELFMVKSIRAGNVIDIFSRAGLFIIGIKVLQMSVAQAERFYGPVKQSLEKKLRESVTHRAKMALQREFGFNIPDGLAEEIGGKLNELTAGDQFNQIVKYMTGRDQRKIAPGERGEPGLVRCLALVYQGIDAVKKIRDIIGSTDPTKAAAATVRREFGHDIMVNAAHASDSVENARREIGIIDFGKDDVGPVIDEYLGKTKNR